MSNNHKLIGFTLMAIIVLVISIVVALTPKKDKVIFKTELGTITIEENETNDLLITGDGEDELSTINCFYTNMDILSTEYLPYDSFSKLNEQTWYWLVDHELSDVTEITIIESSIVSNRSQPMFNCILNNKSKTILIVTYSTPKQAFMFELY